METESATKMQFNDTFVTIYVASIQQSIDFYTGKLGLRLKGRYGDEFAVVEGHGLKIGLHPSNDRHAAGSVEIGFGVDSVDQASVGLRNRGISVGEALMDPPMRFAYLKDPDGVPLYLAEQAEFV
jgi:lactoylglutathione lyase